MTLTVDENTRLELTAANHAEGLYAATDASREHLSAFLPWVNHMQSVADFNNYISHCELLYNQKKEVSFVIIYKENIVGRIGLHHIDLQHKNASLGYWLTKYAEGKGIISKSCYTLITYAFEQLQIHRLQLKAGVKNVKSRAVAEKLLFKREGIQREAELINNEFIDLAIYSLLEEEWIFNKTRL